MKRCFRVWERKLGDMTKRGFVSLIILMFIITLIAILFSVVFCLRTQNVTVVENATINISREDIVSSGGLKTGESIFMINKKKAIDKIEKDHPQIKVVQIKTTSITSIDIIVRLRIKMFYTEFNGKYYVLDEDLKVLEIFEKNTEEPSNEPLDLIYLNSEEFEMSKVEISDLIGTKNQQNIISSLYTSMINVVTDAEGNYLDRDGVKSVIENIEFKGYETFDKIIIKTSYGVVLDIENPTNNLQHKINVCFSTIKQFILDGNNKEKNGTIKVYYDIKNQECCVYVGE